MGQKTSGIERFLAPSLNKIVEEVGSIRADIDAIKARFDEADNRLKKLEEGQNRLATIVDKVNSGLSTEAQVLIGDMVDTGKQNRDGIEILNRAIHVIQRRLDVLESKMKELGQ